MWPPRVCPSKFVDVTRLDAAKAAASALAAFHSAKAPRRRFPFAGAEVAQFSSPDAPPSRGVEAQRGRFGLWPAPPLPPIEINIAANAAKRRSGDGF